MLDFPPGGGVTLSDPRGFDILVGQCVREKSEADMLQLERDDDRLRDKDGRMQNDLRKSYREGLRRWTRLWLPFGRQLVVATVVDQDQAAHSGDEARVAALTKHWQATFDGTAPAPGLGDELADHYVQPWPRELLPTAPPGRSAILAVLAKAQKTAPGPDGIPYGGWADTETGTTLSMLCGHLISHPFPQELRRALLCFVPKKVRDDELDLQEVVRECCDLRPLVLKCTDIKAITATIVGATMAAFSHNLHPSQFGGVPGNNMLDCVVHLDTLSRVAGMRGPVASTLILDMRNAFGAVSHQFLLRVVGKLGLPDGLCNFFTGLVVDNSLVLTAGDACAMLRMGSGVGQGCPASPMLFCLCFDVLLRCLGDELGATSVLREASRGYGGPEELFRAFMDDLAVICPTLGHLSRTGRALKLFGRGTGVALNLSK